MALIQAAHSGGVATITLDSPANRNALSLALMAELLAALEAAAGDDGVRLVELRHTGPVFCSGADLKETQTGDGDALPVARLGEVLTALAEHPKPVLAVVAGPARAGGLGLMAAADVTICADAAHFAFSEVRLGVVPSVISAVVLPRLTSRAAAELFLTGDVFDGPRAAQIGLVSRSVPADDLDAATQALRESLLRGGPGAMRATKRLLRERPVDMAELTALSVRHFTSAEGREGVAAAREKRTPTWLP
ncbi:methylglutaconyl-CoA hydratase [Hamadaea flava]|uniref:Enoyl-CoA hydratase-related protein n=1 Tax=Hamadaea flava TaxID=1742688 RepID=A0ABV8LSH3_9ACTN|nr:enoyl-CoA hydratase-related protein [Hamadaea flava]MCP2327200.1 methylglutaconyl-CoA hydratase [Hamadaea flava]